MKRPAHKNFNAVSHNRARPEVLFLNSTSTFALSIHEVIVQVNLTRLHVDYNPNSTAMLNSKTTPSLGRARLWDTALKFFITSPDHLEGEHTMPGTRSQLRGRYKHCYYIN